METQVVNGIHLPVWDTHFRAQIEKSPIIEGKGTYQYSKIEAAIGLTKRRGHAIDIGAHVGLWSRVLSFHFAKVTAFEPMPDFIRCFELNMADRPNVHLHRFALGDRMTRLPVVSDGIIATAHIATEAELAADVRPPMHFSVDVCRFDDSNWPTIDFMKVDVEGYDVHILKGAETTIRRDHPVIVVEQKGRTEQYGGGRHSATDLLRSWGAEIALELKGDSILAWAETE